MKRIAALWVCSVVVISTCWGLAINMTYSGKAAMNVDMSHNTGMGDVSYATTPSVHNQDTDLYYTTIQEAIDSPLTLDGHTLFLGAGTYNETVSVYKTLNIIGAGLDNCTVQTPDPGMSAFYITADWVNITNLGVTGASGSLIAGIYSYNNLGGGIHNVNSSGNFYGIRIQGCTGIEIENSQLWSNNQGIRCEDSNHGIINGNTIIYNTDAGIRLQGAGSNNVLVEENNVSFNDRGISLDNTHNNTVRGNVAYGSGSYGIEIYRSQNSTFVDNTLIGGDFGIYLHNPFPVSNNVTIQGNNASLNLQNGIHFFSAWNNIIVDNSLCGNIGYGVRITSSSSGNLLYHNNFIDNNPIQAIDDGSNTWDSGYPGGGNYWSDYGGIDVSSGPGQNESGSDGIGDSPYLNIQSGTGAQDRYPIMKKISNGLVQRPPIHIDSNAEFDYAHGVVNWDTGNGTPMNPWIISGWEIDGSGYGYCIYIGNTTDYFTVTNSKLHNASGLMSWPGYTNCGLNLYNATNGEISNITVLDCAIDGIYLKYSPYNRIINNVAIRNINQCGIELSESSNVVVANNSVLDNHMGIKIVLSDNITITGNIASNNMEGMYIGDASHNLVKNNILDHNQYFGIYTEFATTCQMVNNTFTGNGIFIWGDTLEQWNSHVIDTTNSVNGKPVYYWCNRTWGTVPLGAGQVILANCSNVVVEWQNVSDTSVGILVGYSHNTTLRNNVADSERVYGIYMSFSDNNTIINNTISNSITAVRLYFSDNNTVYHNNFINNSNQAYDDWGASNTWDAGYPDGGNYWSDHDEAGEGAYDEYQGVNQDVPGKDGIVDLGAPAGGLNPYYLISGPTPDHYPLTREFVWWTEMAPDICLVSPENNSVMQHIDMIEFDIWDCNRNMAGANYSVNGGPDIAFPANDYTINASEWTDGDYSVVVQAIDELGNLAYGQYTFIVDTTDPVWTIELAIDEDTNGLVDTGELLRFWMNITDENEDNNTVPLIDVDENDFPDQPVLDLTYEGNGTWSFTYVVKAGDFNVSDLDVQFSDAANNTVIMPENYTFSVSGSMEVELLGGWTMISFPVDSPAVGGQPIRRASDLANVTSSIMLAKWDPVSQSYIDYIVGFHLPTDPVNFDIGPNDALFIFTSTDTNLTVRGYEPLDSNSVELRPGWNMVGYHYIFPGDVETDWAGQVSCGDYDDICYYDGDGYVHYIFPGTSMELIPGRGYFVWSDEFVTLTY